MSSPIIYAKELDEFLELFYRFKNEDLGVFDLDECKRYDFLYNRFLKNQDIVDKISSSHYFDASDCSKLIIPFDSYEDACLFSIKVLGKDNPITKYPRGNA